MAVNPQGKRGLGQDRWELEKFIDFMKEQGVRRYLEIGARYGDCFHAIMSALGTGSYGVAVDLPDSAWGRPDSEEALKRAVHDLEQFKRITATLILGDSHDATTVEQVARLGPYDLIFIDADHRYQAVYDDFRNYGHMAQFVAFHDIAGEGQKDGRKGIPVEVPIFWAEVKTKFKHKEFVAPRSRMGIGILYTQEQVHERQ